MRLTHRGEHWCVESRFAPQLRYLWQQPFTWPEPKVRSERVPLRDQPWQEYLATCDVLSIDKSDARTPTQCSGGKKRTSEDNILIAAAVSGTVDEIVTRNPGDFSQSPIRFGTKGFCDRLPSIGLIGRPRVNALRGGVICPAICQKCKHSLQNLLRRHLRLWTSCRNLPARV